MASERESGATFVLVHGAFHGGWVFQAVAARLRAAGHEVHTPTLTGCGDRFHLLTREVGLATHVEDVASVVFHEDLHDVVLVGHSYGGAVVTMVADRIADRLRRVVYLDAAAPVDGQTASGAFATGTADRLAEMHGDDWLLPPLPLAAVGVEAPVLAAWVEPRRHPHPVRTLEEPVVTTGASARSPRAYVRFARKEALVALFGVDPLAPFVERALAERFDLRSLDAGHDAMLTHPDEVAGILLDLDP